MADTFYSVVLGEMSHDQVTTGAATSGETVELRVTDSSSHTKQSLMNAIEAIKTYIVHAGTDAPL